MFEIEEDEVATCRLEDMADAGRCELDNEMTELRRLHSGEILETMRRHSSLPVPSPQHYDGASNFAIFNR
jgi:hypothetical protein